MEFCMEFWLGTIIQIGVYRNGYCAWFLSHILLLYVCKTEPLNFLLNKLCNMFSEIFRQGLCTVKH